MSLNAATPDFLTALENRLGARAMRAPEPRDLEEPRGMFAGQAAAVVLPSSVEQVSEILKACNKARVAVVPMGGGTGLVGGRSMVDGPAPLLISMERMTGIRSVSAANNTMTVEAGAILADVQAAAADAGRLFPLSLAAEGSCRIGGNLATNAGGVNVLRYGNMRDLCLGLEFVLADGTIVGGLKNLRKDNTGFDLRNLVIGSEGALAVITAAVLRLYPQPQHFETAFLAVPSPQAALDLLNRINGVLGGLISAFELIHRAGLEFMDETGVEYGAPCMDAPEWMVLLECGAGPELREMVENALSDAMEAGLVDDAVLAQNETQRQAFWQLRERIPVANKAVGSISSHDISVPVSDVPRFIEAARTLVDPKFRVNCFGHLGDGNLHYNVFAPKGKNRDDYLSQRPVIARRIYDLVAEFGGSFSAEHGVGRLKTGDLARYGDAGRLRAMRLVKDALDPVGIMNPGVILGPR